MRLVEVTLHKKILKHKCNLGILYTLPTDQSNENGILFHVCCNEFVKQLRMHHYVYTFCSVQRSALLHGQNL